jgi:hypothetical protein
MMISILIHKVLLYIIHLADGTIYVESAESRKTAECY